MGSVSWLTNWVRGGSAAISPTAHYTGHVWARHGLGSDELATSQGRALWTLSQTVMRPLELLGGPTLEHFLLARHRIIDHLLAEEIAAGKITQVVELACGMSPRGLDLARRFPDLTYVEVDLPEMAELKRAELRRVVKTADAFEDSTTGRHRVEAADVMAGVQLAKVFSGLDRTAGTAVVTEGLVNYFPQHQVVELWRRISHELRRFPCGLYLSDLHVRSEAGLPDKAFVALLGMAVRGQVALHFDDDRQAEQALRTAAFDSGRLHAPEDFADELPGMLAAGADRVRVVEARTHA